MQPKYRDIQDPVGSWWGAFDNGEVWPVEVIAVTMFGTRVRATHEAAPQGEITLSAARVYDGDFNRPRWGKKPS